MLNSTHTPICWNGKKSRYGNAIGAFDKQNCQTEESEAFSACRLESYSVTPGIFHLLHDTRYISLHIW